MARITILMNCPDQKGIIADVTNYIHKNKGNIEYIDQYVDRVNSIFFMRLECNINSNVFNENFKKELNFSIGQKYSIDFNIYENELKPKMGIMVSKYDHCLYDILSRHQSGELNVEIPFIISNHINLRHIADTFKIPFFHIPIIDKNKKEIQNEHLKIFKKYSVDFIVLARYMQIIPTSIIKSFQNKIINIHHSFLPAFPGAKPYHSAYERGVKIIGATSHYVTKELDAGPIIEQDTTQVSHLNSIQDFIGKGRDLERIVLSKAIKLHIERKVMVYKNKTIIFS